MKTLRSNVSATLSLSAAVQYAGDDAGDAVEQEMAAEARGERESTETMEGEPLRNSELEFEFERGGQGRERGR